MEMHGTNPTEQIDRLLELNEFAQNKPDEYLAWVATQTMGEKPHEAIAGAAKLLGYKLVEDKADDQDDEDLFEDPALQALRDENAALKAKLGGDRPEFGPDTTERRSVRDAERNLQNFVNETGPDGQPLRPYFNMLEGRIGEMARLKVQETGRALTLEDLGGLYDAAVAEIQSAFGTSAAQTQPSVTDLADQKKADAAEKARRASKTIDGSGQGTSRRPALPADASLDDVIAFNLANQAAG
jgi:hypothetical protein